MLSRLCIATHKKLDKRKSARHREQKGLLPSCRPFVSLLALQVGAALLLRYQHSGVFREINPAFVAFSAMALRRGAGRALVKQRSMTPLAELCRIRIRRLALGTFHAPILPRAMARC